MDDLPMYWATMTISLSAHTSSAALQGLLEGGLEKRTKARTSVPYTAARTFACNLSTMTFGMTSLVFWQGMYAPSGGRRMMAFIDDLHMPKPTPSGFMPPLELLKLWMDHGLWYEPVVPNHRFVIAVFSSQGLFL